MIPLAPLLTGASSPGLTRRPLPLKIASFIVVFHMPYVVSGMFGEADPFLLSSSSSGTTTQIGFFGSISSPAGINQTGRTYEEDDLDEPRAKRLRLLVDELRAQMLLETGLLPVNMTAHIERLAKRRLAEEEDEEREGSSFLKGQEPPLKKICPYEEDEPLSSEEGEEPPVKKFRPHEEGEGLPPPYRVRDLVEKIVRLCKNFIEMKTPATDDDAMQDQEDLINKEALDFEWGKIERKFEILVNGIYRILCFFDEKSGQYEFGTDFMWISFEWKVFHPKYGTSIPEEERGPEVTIEFGRKADVGWEDVVGSSYSLEMGDDESTLLPTTWNDIKDIFIGKITERYNRRYQPKSMEKIRSITFGKGDVVKVVVG